MLKSESREIYKAKRSLLLNTEIESKSLSILENLKKMTIWENSVFHIFVPIKNNQEVNTFLIIDYLFYLNKKIIVPKVEGNQMLNCQINPEVEWTKGKFNVPEPEDFQLIDSKEIDIVFLPMLICDKSGNRVGYGGGFYDRFLKSCRQNVIKIGLNFFTPIDKIEGVFPSDVPLDYCVTGDEIVSFAS